MLRHGSPAAGHYGAPGSLAQDLLGITCCPFFPPFGLCALCFRKRAFANYLSQFLPWQASLEVA
jgi:hypothetical protein